MLATRPWTDQRRDTFEHPQLAKQRHCTTVGIRLSGHHYYRRGTPPRTRMHPHAHRHTINQSNVPHSHDEGGGGACSPQAWQSTVVSSHPRLINGVEEAGERERSQGAHSDEPGKGEGGAAHTESPPARPHPARHPTTRGKGTRRDSR